MRSHEEYRATMKKKIRWVLNARGPKITEDSLNEIIVSCLGDMSPGEVHDLFLVRDHAKFMTLIKRNLILFTLPHRRPEAGQEIAGALFNAAAEHITALIDEVQNETNQEQDHE